MKQFYFLSFMLWWICGHVSLAQYQSKMVKIDTDEYKGTAEVCTNCQDVKADANKNYRWYKDGKIEESKGSFQGQLLHGKLELYNEGFDGGKESIIEGSFHAGLKNGQIKNYLLGGILETIEKYEQGTVKSIEYYSGDEDKEKNIVVKKCEYINYNPTKSKVKLYYYSSGSKLIGEGYQIPIGRNYSNFYDGKFQKIFTDGDGKDYVKEEGSFVKNRRHGEWKIYYNDDVVAVCQYENDILVSEQFQKGDQPYTGLAQEYSPTRKTLRTTIEVKNGLRDGKTMDSYSQNDKKEWISTHTIMYQAGNLISGISDLNKFLKENKATKEIETCKQCDERGNDLYLDRIQFTEKGALVYFHQYNDSNGTISRIYTSPPGDKSGFSAIDVNTKQVFKLKDIFKIGVQPAFNIAYNGEVTCFVLYFEGLTPNTKKISLMEGDPENPYTIDEKGNTTTSWGCYEMDLK